MPPLQDNVEVNVEYCGLNFADLYTRMGIADKICPFILGMECSGTVTKIGETAKTDLKVNQSVLKKN